MTARRLLIGLGVGLILTLGTSFVEASAQAVHAEIMGCERACEVAAAGWPLPYLIDYPGLSVVGSVDLLGALIGEDQIRWIAFGLNMLVWTAVALTADWIRRRIRGRRS